MVSKLTAETLNISAKRLRPEQRIQILEERIEKLEQDYNELIILLEKIITKLINTN